MQIDKRRIGAAAEEIRLQPYRFVMEFRFSL